MEGRLLVSGEHRGTGIDIDVDEWLYGAEQDCWHIFSSVFTVEHVERGLDEGWYA